LQPKQALNNGISAALFAPSSYLMKSPPKQSTDTEARDLTEKFIARHAKKEAKRKAGKKAAPKKK
jgi:myo-inositol-1-phosphate synthase